MVVAADAFRAMQEGLRPPIEMARSAGEDEDTRKEFRYRRPSGNVSSGGGGGGGMLMSASTSSFSEAQIIESFADGMSEPASLSASGVFRPMPGVQRQVTGLFFPELDQLQLEGKPTSSRVWYTAIDGRPRGPFSASEMMSLAERGKIRDATLVWRPGFESWKKVRHGEATSGEDLSWLRKIVLARKLREIDAHERDLHIGAPQLKGASVQLTRSKAGGVRPTYKGGARGMPPSLPSDDDESADMSLPLSTLQTPSSGVGAWRADELPALATAEGVSRHVSAASMIALAAVVMAVVIAIASSVLTVVDVAMLDL